MDPAVLADRIAQSHAVANHFSIDEDRDVLAERCLIVKHVRSRLWVFREHGLQNLGDAAATSFRLRTSDVPLEILCEYDPRHRFRPFDARR
jgi:hypothetical protein